MIVKCSKNTVPSDCVFALTQGPKDFDHGQASKLNWVSSCDCDTGRPTDQYLGECNHTRIKFKMDAAPERLFTSRFLPGGKSINTMYYPGSGYVEDIQVHSIKKQGNPFSTIVAIITNVIINTINAKGRITT